MRKGNETKKRRKLLPAMLAVALAAVMIAPMGSGVAKAADLSLKVNVANPDYVKEDPALNNVKLKIYKLADLTEGNGTYSWDLTKDFADENLEELLDEASAPGLYTSDQKKALNEKYQELAGQATAKIIDKKMTTSDETAFGSAKDIAEKGLYIVVPVLGDAIETDEDTGLVTITTDEWVYTFNPLIISVPTKTAKDGSIGTADEYGDWISPDISLDIDEDVQVDAKVVRTPNKGNIVISKTLSRYETKAPATFVFSIEATKGTEKVYSDVVSLTFTDAGTQSRLIPNIPMKAEVTVKEIYAGPSYTKSDAEYHPVVTTEDDMATILAEEKDSVAAYTNDYDNTFHGGGGIENQFDRTVSEKFTQVINGVAKAATE